MRLLFVDFTLPYLLADEEFPVGGWAVQLEQWLYGLSEIGVRAAVLTWKGANAHVGRKLPFELIESFDPKTGFRVAKYFYSYIPAILAVARVYEPDAIVQSTRSIYTAIMAYIAGRLDVPFIYRVASDADVDSRAARGLQLYERLAYRHGLEAADLVICQNEYQSTQIMRARPARPVLRIQNSTRIARDALPPRGPADRKYIAWLGVFRYEKNMPLLARVAEALPDIDFQVAGMPGRGADRETLASVDVLKRLPNVCFVGYLKRMEVGEFLAGAMALLCTSHLEGFSNTFLEAFAAGTPVLTRRGVDPDGIVAGHGLGFVAASDGDLIANVRRLAQMNATEYDSLALHCRSYLESHHDPCRSMQRLVEAVEYQIRERTARTRAGRH